MTKQLKIKLTKEQIKEVVYGNERCCFGLFTPCILKINESQIVREKSNVEKWEEVLSYDGEMGEDWFGEMMDRLGYNADAAYKEVVGNG